MATSASDPPQKPSHADPVAQLSQGLLSNFEAPIASITDRLSDLSVRQVDLADATAAEADKYARTPEGTLSVQDMIDTTRVYHAKLEHCKRDMDMISTRSAEMRARAMRLQEAKQREALRRENKRIKEREREEMLLAKPASKE